MRLSAKKKSELQNMKEILCQKKKGMTFDQVIKGGVKGIRNRMQNKQAVAYGKYI